MMIQAEEEASEIVFFFNRNQLHQSWSSYLGHSCVVPCFGVFQKGLRKEWIVLKWILFCLNEFQWHFKKKEGLEERTHQVRRRKVLNLTEVSSPKRISSISITNSSAATKKKNKNKNDNKQNEPTGGQYRRREWKQKNQTKTR